MDSLELRYLPIPSHNMCKENSYVLLVEVRGLKCWWEGIACADSSLEASILRVFGLWISFST